MDTPMGNTYEAQRARPAPSSSGAETPSQLLSSTHPRLPPPSTMASLPAIRALPETLAQSSLPTRSPLPLAGTEIRYHPYAASSGSPSSVSGSMAESSEQYATAGISPTQIAAPGLGPQKRAYRQRRKDPSCDACRERKVKCDATDTSACSECLSRSVECRFTKETNRRMSSIKQVQELQSQLDDARRQIDSMRSVIDAGNQEASRPRLPRAEMSSERMPAGYTHSPQAIPGLDEVRQNLQIYSRGVFKVPQPHRQNVSMPAMRRDDPEVPQAEMVEELLKTFHDQMHRQAPMIHWPSFYAQWEKARDANNFAGLSQTWVALFFIVLACGTLQASSSVSPDIEGLRFYVIAARLLNTWTDHLVVDHAKTALLISIYLYEQNVRSASWVWLGTAIRISQEVGLELKEGPWSRTEFEGRVRTYWAIVSWDRLLALQENKTIYMNIAEDDESWPTTVGDHWLHPRGNLPPPENVPGYSTVSIVIPVVRYVGHLTKSLRAKTIAPDVLRRYDEDFRNWNGHLPEPLQLQSESWLEPFAFSAVVPLLMIQFQLYRHNLNLYASIHERHDALKRCHTICRDTVKYLRRTMQDPPANTNRGSVGYRSQTWQQMLDAMAHNLLCRHVWRCTLILCLRGDFMSALTCVEFLKAIGDARKLNIACGRNLAFFLDRLTEKTVRGAAQQDLESDLAMIAYASGDLQGSQNGFVWVGVESQPPQTATASSSSNLRLLLDEETPLSATALLTDKEVNDWGGWSHVEDQIGRLIEEQDRRTHSHYSFRPSASQSPVYHRSTHNETKRVQLAPPSGSPSPGPGTTTGASSTRASTPPTGANRISIAHLI